MLSINLAVFIITIILCIIACCCELDSKFSVFNCGDADSPGWEITPDIDQVERKRFLNFIHFWQHDCPTPENKKGISNDINPWGGISWTIHNNMFYFLLAIEMGKIYRPIGQYHWVWAEYSEPKNCSLGLGDIDCFFKPLSNCTFNIINSFDSNAWEEDIKSIDINLGREYAKHLGFRDICTAAKYTKKSVQWVHGQYVEYIIRSRTDIAPMILLRKNMVFEHITNKSHELSVSVQYRGQQPDEKRKPAPLSVYIEQIDKFSKIAEAQGKVIKVVYICSYDQKSNIVSSDHMASLFPRPWTYVVLDHLTMGSIEAEYSLMKLYPNDIKSSPDLPSKRDLVMEFMADIEILASTDIYIGTFSNIYTTVGALRIARNVSDKSNTCYVHISGYVGIPPVYCEGSEEAKAYWRSRAKPGGYMNPSSFG